MTDDNKSAAEIIVLVEGRLINHSLLERDQYDEKSTPSYKAEVAYKKGLLEDAGTYDALYDAADAKWGEGAGDDEDLIIPILDGDKLARKREKKGKEGDAYEGMEVIRANSIFNHLGEAGPGGAAVFDMDGETPINSLNSSEIYQGCNVIMAVTIGFYTDARTGGNALKFYLSAIQKSGDGERLVAQKDHSKLFKPVGRKKGEAEKRSRRKG